VCVCVCVCVCVWLFLKDEWGDNLQSFAAHLTPSERARSEVYKRKWPFEVADLGQAPEVKPTKSRNGVLKTIVRNAGIMYSDTHKRWMTTQDVWTAMGFPIDETCVDALCGTTCQFTRGGRRAPGRTRRSQIVQCGNSMHVNFIGAISWLLLVKLPALGRIATSPHAVPPRPADSQFATVFNKVRLARRATI
jgi:hypothetical protein